MRIRFDSPIMQYMNNLAEFIALNLVFLFCCLPIITIGPAIAALYQVTLRETRGEHGYIIKKYFQHFKSMFLQGMVTFLLYALGILLMVYSIAFWHTLNGMLAILATTLCYLCTFLLFTSFLYVFPLMARFTNTIRQTIKNAFLIAITNLSSTMILLVIQVFVIALLYLFPVCRVLMLLLGFSFVALCNSYLLTKVFRQYESAA